MYRQQDRQPQRENDESKGKSLFAGLPLIAIFSVVDPDSVNFDPDTDPDPAFK